MMSVHYTYTVQSKNTVPDGALGLPAEGFPQDIHNLGGLLFPDGGLALGVLGGGRGGEGLEVSRAVARYITDGLITADVGEGPRDQLVLPPHLLLYAPYINTMRAESIPLPNTARGIDSLLIAFWMRK